MLTFSDSTDTKQYSALNEHLITLFRTLNTSDKSQRDSLVFEIGKLRIELETLAKRSNGFRYIYKPSYTMLDDVHEDSIATCQNLTISGHASMPKRLYAFQNLRTLELLDMKLNKLPRKLKKLPNLVLLKVYNNESRKSLSLARNKGIKSLTIGSSPIPKKFKRYKLLERLDLSRNNLTSFPNIEGCKKLKELSLRENKLTLDDLTGTSSNLESLELQQNIIKSIPSSIQRFPELKKLVLNYNQIDFIDPAIAKLTELEQLGLYENQLGAIPSALFELDKLKEIDLYFNNIERLDSGVSKWQNLKVLYLSNNKLLSVPENIGDLPLLEELYLHNNRLSYIPETIGKAHNLKVLRVNNNYLGSLPNSIARLKYLENLDISNNQLRTISIDFFQIETMKLFTLKANPWEKEAKQEISIEAKRLEQKGVIVNYDTQRVEGAGSN